MTKRGHWSTTLLMGCSLSGPVHKSPAAHALPMHAPTTTRNKRNPAPLKSGVLRCAVLAHDSQTHASRCDGNSSTRLTLSTTAAKLHPHWLWPRQQMIQTAPPQRIAWLMRALLHAIACTSVRHGFQKRTADPPYRWHRAVLCHTTVRAQKHVATGSPCSCSGV